MTGPLPDDSAARKTYPMYSGLLQYFPAALAAVAHHSFLGNEKHNPGQALHWARGKSDDHLDAAARHLAEGDLTGAAWRLLAALQLEREANGAPMAPGARAVPKSAVIPHDLAAAMKRDGVIPPTAAAVGSVIRESTAATYSPPPNCEGMSSNGLNPASSTAALIERGEADDDAPVKAGGTD